MNKEEIKFVDWNKFSLDQLADYLEEKYLILSSGEALAIHKLVKFYREHKSAQPKQGEGEKPKIICLCGSTRFYEAFRKANLKETLKCNIVLSIGCDFKSDDGLGLSKDIKIKLDELHLRKIDLADEIFVLNVGGYIGESTRNEIKYAEKEGKPIRYLKPLNK